LGACLNAIDAAVDGEIVFALARTARRSSPISCAAEVPQHFYAFDLLWLNGCDHRGLPLLERKRRLREIVPPRRRRCCTCTTSSAPALDLFEAVCRNDLEGIVAKRAEGRYTPEEPTWVKIKNRNYGQVEGRRELFEKRRGAAR